MNLIDYSGSPIKTILADNGSNCLVILYPGMGYNLNCPLFFFLKQLISDMKYNCLGIDYRYSKNEAFLKLDDPEQMKWISYDSNIIADAIRAYSKTYERLIYIG
jgi:hypothetical protein